MPPTIQDTRRRVDARLKNYFDTQVNKAAKIAPTFKRLWQTLDSVTSDGGKRLRPYMIMLAYKAYGGKHSVVDVAAAWELMHSCLLIHDDIMDRELTRRGKPNIAGNYLKVYADSADALHHANVAALLGGDLALTGVFDILQQSTLSGTQKLTAIKLFCDSLYSVAGGQLMDCESVMLPIQKVDTEHVAFYKSAKYSFTDPMLVGATLAGAGKQELAKITKLGNSAGIGFQLADDLLGVFGDETVTGKSASSDMREGKRTILLQEVMTRATKTNQVKLATIAGKPDISESEIAFVRQLVVDSGAKQAVEDRIANYSQQALAIVETLQVPQSYKTAIAQLVDMALNRSH